MIVPGSMSGHDIVRSVNRRVIAPFETASTQRPRRHPSQAHGTAQDTADHLKALIGADDDPAMQHGDGVIVYAS